MASDLEFRIGGELGELKKTLAAAQAELKAFGAKAQTEVDKATRPRGANGRLLPAGSESELARARTGVKGISAEVGNLNKQFGSAVSTVKTFAAAFVAFKGVGVLRDMIAAGVEFNSVMEQSKLGIAAIVAAQATLVDAQGKTVEGQDALRVAIGLSEEQMKKLRIAGLETAATTQQLVEAYQAAIGAGLGAGLNLDEIRGITVQLVQAASALGVPMNQLNQEVRSILDGTIDINSRVATTLGITNQQVAKWKQSGTLVEELNKRMASFADAGKLAADNFEVIKSNGVEAIQAIAGEITGGLFSELKGALKDATAGLFDLQTLGITEEFKDLIDLAKELTTGIGSGIAGAIRGAVAMAQELSAWIRENRGEIDQIVGGLGLALKAFGSLVAMAFKLVGGVAEAGAKLGVFSTALKIISVIIASIQDGFTVIGASIVGLGATIVTVLIAPFQLFLDTIAQGVSVINEEAGKSLKTAADGLRSIGESGFKAAGDMLKPIADGKGAVAESVRQLNLLAAATKKAAEEREKLRAKGPAIPVEAAPQGRITGQKNPIKLPGADSNQILKAQLERQLKVLDQMYQDSLISLADYYSQRSRLQKAAIDAEIAEERAKQAKIPKTDENANRDAATRIALLGEKRRAIDADNDREALAAKRDLYRQIDEVQAQSLQNQGDLQGAAAIRLQAQYRDLLAKLRANGKEEAASIIEGLIDTETAKAKFEELRILADRAFAELATKTERITAQRDTGQITNSEATEQQAAARAVAIEQVGALNAKMQELAATTTDPAIKQGADDLAASFTNLGISTATGIEAAMIGLRKSMAELQASASSQAVTSAVDGLSDMFTSIADGSKGAGEALKDFVHGFAQSMIQLAAKALATFLVLETLDAIYPGLGQLAVGGGNVAAKAHHTGGIVGAGGASRSVSPLAFFGAPRYHEGGLVGLAPDERPAILLTGERVLNRDQTREYDGKKSGGGGGNGMRVINVLDPSLVEGYLQSAQGEDAILNVIGRNPSKVSQMIRS